MSQLTKAAQDAIDLRRERIADELEILEDRRANCRKALAQLDASIDALKREDLDLDRPIALSIVPPNPATSPADSPVRLAEAMANRLARDGDRPCDV